jgi:hypothetical protein
LYEGTKKNRSTREKRSPYPPAITDSVYRTLKGDPHRAAVKQQHFLLYISVREQMFGIR